jgi:hypothetical protein
LPVDAPLPTGEPAAACTAALAFVATAPEEVRQRIRRLVLESRAGLDDFVAAALLASPAAPWGAGARERIAAVARADNADYSSLGPWRPGQRLPDVTTTFPGLSRLCACQALPVARRVELVARWLREGDFELRSTEHSEPGVYSLVPFDRGSPSERAWLDREAMGLQVYNLRDLDRMAGEELLQGRKQMSVRVFADDRGPLVALVTSQRTGLSAALPLGLEAAPVVVALSVCRPCSLCGGRGEVTPYSCSCTGTDGPRRLVTIARATNAAGQVDLDWVGVRDALNHAEEIRIWAPCAPLAETNVKLINQLYRLVDHPAPQLWGGNPTSCILGSPKPEGTRLGTDDISAVVRRHVRRAA